MADQTTKTAIKAYSFHAGQIWHWSDTTVEIGLVGKTLVHYRHYKAGTKRPPILLASKRALERFLQSNRARLQMGPTRPIWGTGVTSGPEEYSPARPRKDKRIKVKVPAAPATGTGNSRRTLG
jgi:hypothetical protein